MGYCKITERNKVEPQCHITIHVRVRLCGNSSLNGDTFTAKHHPNLHGSHLTVAHPSKRRAEPAGAGTAQPEEIGDTRRYKGVGASGIPQGAHPHHRRVCIFRGAQHDIRHNPAAEHRKVSCKRISFFIRIIFHAANIQTKTDTGKRPLSQRPGKIRLLTAVTSPSRKKSL